MDKQLEMEKFIPKMSPGEFGQFVKEQFAIGRPVIYYKRMVDGVGSGPVSTKITSAPWQLGHGEWVCKVDGVTGCVPLSHLRFVEDGVCQGIADPCIQPIPSIEDVKRWHAILVGRGEQAMKEDMESTFYAKPCSHHER